MKLLSVTCLLLTASTAYAQSESSSAFLGEDENSPNVRAFYQQQCEKFGVGQVVGTTGSDAMSHCLKEMKAISPIGYADE